MWSMSSCRRLSREQWTIGQGEFERTYVQRPLSFIAKMQWFSLVGEVLDKAMSGDNALTVGQSALGSGRARSRSLIDERTSAMPTRSFMRSASC